MMKIPRLMARDDNIVGTMKIPRCARNDSYFNRRSSTSDTMNPNPGHPPDFTDR